MSFMTSKVKDGGNNPRVGSDVTDRMEADGIVILVKYDKHCSHTHMMMCVTASINKTKAKNKNKKTTATTATATTTTTTATTAAATTTTRKVYTNTHYFSLLLLALVGKAVNYVHAMLKN